jgi:hypothetical protein
MEKENKSREEIVDKIDDDSDLKPAAKSTDLKLWYDKLSVVQQRQVETDVNSVLYSGCMAAAPQLFDKRVCQQEADDDDDDDNVVGDWDPDDDLVVGGGCCQTQ